MNPFSKCLRAVRVTRLALRYGFPRAQVEKVVDLCGGDAGTVLYLCRLNNRSVDYMIDRVIEFSRRSGLSGLP